MNVEVFILSVFALSIMACKDTDNTPENPLKDRIHAQLKAYSKNNRFNGSVLITRGDSTLYHEHFGWANRGKRVPISDSTVYLIGSITKPFTALAILQLVNEGKLSLDQKLSDFFPKFPGADGVSIEHLLNHQSGIKDYHSFSKWEELSQKRDYKAAETLDWYNHDVYRFEPGQGFRYSNTGYILLGLIIEKLSGMSFKSYIDSAISQPLALHHTGVYQNTPIPHLAKGYRSLFDSIRTASYINIQQPFSSGNMYSTPQDLRRFTRAVFKESNPQKQHIKTILEGERYVFGWGIRDYTDSSRAIGHIGAMNGFCGSITYYPDEDLFICILTNDDNTPKYTITEQLSRLMHGEDIDLPTQYQSVALDENSRKQYLGNYLIQPGDTLTVYQDDGQLFMQETGQTPLALFAVGDKRFIFEQLEMEALFIQKEGQSFNKIKLEGLHKIEAIKVN